MIIDMEKQVAFSHLAARWQEVMDTYPDEIPDTAENRIAQATFLVAATELGLSILRNKNISDTVRLTYQEDDLLCEMVKEFTQAPDAKHIKCPADILLAKTLPIRNIEFFCDERGKVFDDPGVRGEVVRYTVQVVDNYAEIVDSLGPENGNKFRMIGVGYTDRCTVACFPLLLKYGVSGVVVMTIPTAYKNAPNLLGHMDKLSGSFVSNFLTTWYAVQIAMLNPAIKEVFEHPKTVHYTTKPKSGSKKRKVHYQRIYTIHLSDLEQRLYGGDRKIHRKCLCWYVIGHWREYKSGKKIFVQGFWKGALRETRRNYDEGREREISDQNKTKEDNI